MSLLRKRNRKTSRRNKDTGRIRDDKLTGRKRDKNKNINETILPALYPSEKNDDDFHDGDNEMPPTTAAAATKTTSTTTTTMTITRHYLSSTICVMFPVCTASCKRSLSRLLSPPHLALNGICLLFVCHC